MKIQKFAIASGVAGALATVSLGFAGAAGAVPSGLGSAADIVKTLQAQGYNVMINGTKFGPLSSCGVTAVHNPAGSDAVDAMGRAAQFTTVYVDISCPSNNT